jgi:hypothetical protein
MLNGNFVHRIKIFFNINKFKKSITNSFLSKNKFGIEADFNEHTMFQLIYKSNVECLIKKFEDKFYNWFFNDLEFINEFLLLDLLNKLCDDTKRTSKRI